MKLKSKKKFHIKNEINVTPLVDVMLVLLIIFMVAAPMMSVNVPVDLPKTKGVSSQQSEQEMSIISIDRNEKTFLKDQEMSIENIAKQLKDEKNKQIFLRADTTLSYGKVMKIMGILSQFGFSSVSLVGEE